MQILRQSRRANVRDIVPQLCWPANKDANARSLALEQDLCSKEFEQEKKKNSFKYLAKLMFL